MYLCPTQIDLDRNILNQHIILNEFGANRYLLREKGTPGKLTAEYTHSTEDSITMMATPDPCVVETPVYISKAKGLIHLAPLWSLRMER